MIVSMAIWSIQAGRHAKRWDPSTPRGTDTANCYRANPWGQRDREWDTIEKAWRRNLACELSLYIILLINYTLGG